MFSDDELMPISALQHLAYCPRRCALVHLEGIWTENVQTAEGRVLHQRVHEAPSEMSHGVRVVRGLRLCSLDWGLIGVTDVVEFHPLADETASGVALAGLPGRWRPFPVEYKRGRRKPEVSYLVQLCAQALCLEEMLNTTVPDGALYHGQSHRRQAVTFDAHLRQRTQDLARALHELIAAGHTPAPQHGPKCRYCSLSAACLPKLPPSRSARRYLSETVRALLER
jgi:CRISPR-associated exonuclease Cas4